MDRGGWNYPTGDFRVSDADRDRAFSELSVAFQVGRLTADEFDQRSSQALAARTGSQLTALLGDLPVDLPVERAPAIRRAGLERARRALATRIAIAATIGATCFAAASAAAALSSGPTAAQRELIWQMVARQGLRAPPLPPSPGFDWIGTITPGVIAVLLVVLVILMRVHLARGDRT